MPQNSLSIPEIKAAANEYANLNRHKNTESRMMTLAISSDARQKVFGMSGNITPPDDKVDPTKPFPQYLAQFAPMLPWLTCPSPGPANRPYQVCSEAHVWLELMGRGRNPRDYTVVSFNKLGIIAAPCENCALWVEKAFGAVYKETTSYAGHDRQKP